MILLNGLDDRFLVSIDTIVQIAKKNKDVWELDVGNNLRGRRIAVDKARHNLHDIIVSLTHTILARVQVAINKDQSLVNEIKLDLDSTLVPNHVLEARGDDIEANIAHQRTKTFRYKRDHMSRLKAH